MVLILSTHLGSCALDCDLAYFEVRIGDKNPAKTRVGLKRVHKKQAIDLSGELNPTDSESPSWIFDYKDLKAGDVVGVHWDQTDLPMLSFTLNGIEYAQAAVTRIRPTQDIYPAVSIVDGSCEFIFDEDGFIHKPRASKFQMIVCATSLI